MTESDGMFAALLREALPSVHLDARYWDERASEAQNRRRQDEARDLAQRILYALYGL